MSDEIKKAIEFAVMKTLREIGLEQFKKTSFLVGSKKKKYKKGL